MKIGTTQLGYEATNSYGMHSALRDLPGLVNVSEKTAKACDVLLVSLFWWLHVWELPQWLRRAGILRPDGSRVGPKIYVGGFQTFNPLPILPYVDGVLVGDGEGIRSIEDLQSLCYTGEGSVDYRSVNPVPSFSHRVRTGTRIEIARGCKRRCAFCAVSHLKPYREVDFDEVKRHVRESSGPVMLFAPSTSQYSRKDELEDLIAKLGIVRADTDVCFEELGKRERGWAQRFGLDGLSEKLRKSVNKPLKNKALVDRVAEMLSAKGRLALYYYLIVDLPGEWQDDWDEYREMVLALCHLPGAEGLHVNPICSAFMPIPHTKLEGAGINLDFPIVERLRLAYANTPNAAIVHRLHRVLAFHPVSRLLSMIAVRAGPEFVEIEAAAHAARLVWWGTEGLEYARSLTRWERLLRPWGGVERYCGPREVGDMPWKCVRAYSAGLL
jgi:radical SAM superfamily enzyme YgiQ (UPF0313 family)